MMIHHTSNRAAHTVLQTTPRYQSPYHQVPAQLAVCAHACTDCMHHLSAGTAAPSTTGVLSKLVKFGDELGVRQHSVG